MLYSHVQAMGKPWLWSVLVLAPPFACAEERRLTRLVILGRHSVDNPYRPAHEAVEPGVINFPAASYTKETLLGFGATAPGQLTPHGRALMRSMGAYLAERYAPLLRSSACEDVVAYADPTSSKCVDSAEEILLSLMQGRCPAAVNRAAPREVMGRLFREFPDNFDLAQDCGPPTRAELRGAVGFDGAHGDLAESAQWLQAYRRPLAVMQDRLKCCSHEVCGSRDASGSCTLFDLPSELFPNVTRRAVSGGIGVASWFAEVFAMQFCNGDVGWGVKEEELPELLSLLEMPLAAGVNIITSQHLGSELLWALLRALRPRAKGSLAVSLYLGHGASLLFLRQMLRLSWFSAGWVPNLAEPGGMLVFEVYQEPDGRETVSVVKIAATPRQQHTAARLSAASPPSVSELWVPGCHGLSCELPAFLSLAASALRRDCVQALVQPNATTAAWESAAAAEAATAAAAAVAHGTEGEANWIPASSVRGGPMAEATKEMLLATQPPGADEDGGGIHATLVFGIVICIFGLGWRHMRKQHRLRSGYEVLGASSPGFSL